MPSLVSELVKKRYKTISAESNDSVSFKQPLLEKLGSMSQGATDSVRAGLSLVGAAAGMPVLA